MVNLLFTPAILVLNRLGYRNKFGIMGVLALVAIGVLAANLYQSQDKIIRDSRQELWLTTSGEECGRTQAAAFADETFCDRQLVWTTAGRFELAPLDAARLLK